MSASPFVKAARLLLDGGYPRDAVIEMRRPNTADWALQGRLEAVAATVMDDEITSRCAKNSSPARDPEQGGEARRRIALVLGRFWGRTMTPSNESARRNSQARRPTADHAFAARGGRHRVGPVVEHHDKFLTYDIDDLNVGKFATLRDAMRALPAAQKTIKQTENRAPGREERRRISASRPQLTNGVQLCPGR